MDKRTNEANKTFSKKFFEKKIDVNEYRVALLGMFRIIFRSLRADTNKNSPSKGSGAAAPQLKVVRTRDGAD